jgi:hypothetical protein
MPIPQTLQESKNAINRIGTLSEGEKDAIRRGLEGIYNAAIANAGAQTFLELLDTPSSYTPSQFLRFNGGGTAVESAALSTVATTGSYSDLSGTPTIPADLSDLSDANITAPSTNDFIRYDGAEFINVAGSTVLDLIRPTTTKGDILVDDGAGLVRVGVGANGEVLEADSAQATGVKWAVPASGFADPMTTRGDVIFRNSSNITARLGRGTANQLLHSDGTDIAWNTLDISWDATPSLGGTLNLAGNGFNDSNGNEMFVFTETASAVNHFSFVSAAAGNGISLLAVGDDADIDLAFTPKGTGSIILDYLTLPPTDGSANQILETDGAGNLSWVAKSGSGIANVVDDTTPQLGGNLDVNGFDLVSISNGNIRLLPNGSGNVVLDVHTWPNTDGSANQFLQTDGAGALSWVTPSSTFLALTDTPGAYSANQWVKANSGGTALEFITSPVTDIIGTSPITKSGTTSVTIGIQAASGAQHGYFSSSNFTKLSGIETNADVTDATNVDAAGAIMDSNFSANGLMVRTASGAYVSRTLIEGNGINIDDPGGVAAAPKIELDYTLSTSAPSGSAPVGRLWFRYVP